MASLSDTLPTFASCPQTGSDPDKAHHPPWHLLGQVKANMTIINPTLILTDRAGDDFALTFDDADADLSGFRTGWTAVVPGARRTATQPGRETGERKGFVRVPGGQGADVRVVPAGITRVVELAERRIGGGRERPRGSSDDAEDRCDGCGGTGGSPRKCMGCAAVRYCGKDCQTTAWKSGHKADCKALGAIADIWKG